MLYSIIGIGYAMQIINPCAFDVLAISRLQLINTLINTLFSEACAFLME